MTIEREPHRIFAAYWIAWILATLVQYLVGTMNTWWFWLAAFLVVELPGSFIDTGKRDTLSECATWLHRKLSKTRVFARGWGAFMAMIIFLLALVGSMPMWIEYRRFVHIASVPTMLVLVFIWLWDHWVNPDKYG